jgi:hypothetical protein
VVWEAALLKKIFDFLFFFLVASCTHVVREEALAMPGHRGGRGWLVISINDEACCVCRMLMLHAFSTLPE